MFKILILCAAFIITTANLVNAVHYYNVDKEVPIYIDSTRLVIKFDNTVLRAADAPVCPI